MKILEKNVYSCDCCGNYRGIVKEKMNDIVHVYCLCDLNHLKSIPSPCMISKDGVTFYWKPISEYKNEGGAWVHVAHFAGPILENKNTKISKDTKKT